MPTRSFDRESLRKKEVFDATIDAPALKTINGKLVEKSDNKQFKLQSAVKTLKTKGIGFNNMPKVDFGDQISASYYILESVGITPVGVLNEKPSFISARDMRTSGYDDNDPAGNQISARNIGQQLLSPVKSFSTDETNPFYNLDPGPSTVRYHASKKIKESQEAFDPSDVVVIFYELNTSKSNNKNKTGIFLCLLTLI